MPSNMTMNDNEEKVVEFSSKHVDDGSDQIDNGQSDEDEETKSHEKKNETNNNKKKIHKLSLTETENFNEMLKKRGVLYLARVPPKMTPTKVKALLSEFGEVTRVYLVEEDESVRKRRRKDLGRSGGKRYLEGWIEFANKRTAKHVATSLNNTPISNQKRNPHYGDLWNVKYLSKFQWSHLTEKVAYERRVREQKLRVEMMQARRENAVYAALVETGKKLDKIEERKRKRGDEPLLLSRPHDDDDTEKGGDINKRTSKNRKELYLTPMNDGADKPANLALLGGLL